MIDLQINPFTFALYFLAAAYFAVAEVFQSFGFFPLLITSGLSCYFLHTGGKGTQRRLAGQWLFFIAFVWALVFFIPVPGHR